MNWHIGQEIVCIDSTNRIDLKEGKVYQIKGLKIGCCTIDIDVGFRSTSYDLNVCRNCGIKEKYDGKNWARDSRFAPLEYDQNAIEELLENALVKTN